MLINLTNHPHEKWGVKQKEIALSQFGSVENLSFPEIDPLINIEVVSSIADQYLSICITKLAATNDQSNAVHISGEPCFLFQFVSKAKANKLPCICSTTRRIVTNDNNIKTSIFQFEQFRSYF